MKRILKEIRLDRIAAVDRPCVEGAVATLIKRVEPMPRSFGSFEQAVETIRKREGCSRADAMSKARRRYPAAFAEFQKSAPPRGSSKFERLVATDMAKGCTREIAMQRAILKGALPDDETDPGSAIEDGSGDQAADAFWNLVEQVMDRDGVSRTVAMQRVAREYPNEYNSYRTV